MTTMCLMLASGLSLSSPGSPAAFTATGQAVAVTRASSAASLKDIGHLPVVVRPARARPSPTSELPVSTNVARVRLTVGSVLGRNKKATFGRHHRSGSRQLRLSHPATAWLEAAHRLIRLVAEDEQPTVLLRLIQQARLLFEHTQRVQVRRHRPRHAQVWGLANEIPCQRTRQLAGAQDHDLTPGGVTADVAHLDSRQDLRISAQELDQAMPVGERRKVVRHVARLAAHIRVQPELPLAALDEVARLRERQPQTSALIAPREAARVVPMQVRCDDRIDLVGTDAEPA